jgi:hypothetical protein
MYMSYSCPSGGGRNEKFADYCIQLFICSIYLIEKSITSSNQKGTSLSGIVS